MPRFHTAGDESRRRQSARLFAIGAFFAFLFSIVVCRAVAFHLKGNAQLEKVALRQYRTAVRQSTKRGKIVDAVGRELAINVQVESIYADPRMVQDPLQTATLLTRVLNVDQEKLKGKLTSRRKFIWIKRQVTADEGEAVRALGLQGIFSMNESRRSYPNGRLASTILGAVGFDVEALGGIELVYNDILLSEQNPNNYRRDARGHLYLSPTDITDDQKLSQIELTIDATLQYIAERELEKAVKSARARGGVVVIADPGSGEILAMGGTPSFDPNVYSQFDPVLWKNRATTDAYEPGSTFKVAVIAAALDQGLTLPDEVIDCQHGKLIVGPKVVRDAHPHDKITVADVVRVSSNIGAAKLGQRFSRRHLYDSLVRFGFGRTTGVGLPGESPGILVEASKWSALQQVTIAFGQGVSATPLQMTMAFAAIANGGELLRPRIVKRVTTAHGQEMEVPGREVRDHPIRPETARLMIRLLEAVAHEGGTGTLAASSEYSVAGKTGTAQKVDPHSGGYAEGKYFSSFIGFAPSTDPRIVVYVGIDEPGGDVYYGGQVAAPAFRRIVEETLHYLKIPARRATTVLASFSPAKEEARTSLLSEGIERHFVAVGTGRWQMPDLAGLTMRSILESSPPAARVRWKFEGSGVAVDQQPPPGSVVPSGTECRVVFRSLL